MSRRTSNYNSGSLAASVTITNVASKQDGGRFLGGGRKSTKSDTDPTVKRRINHLNTQGVVKSASTNVITKNVSRATSSGNRKFVSPHQRSSHNEDDSIGEEALSRPTSAAIHRPQIPQIVCEEFEFDRKNDLSISSFENGNLDDDFYFLSDEKDGSDDSYLSDETVNSSRLSSAKSRGLFDAPFVRHSSGKASTKQLHGQEWNKYGKPDSTNQKYFKDEHDVMFTSRTAPSPIPNIPSVSPLTKKSNQQTNNTKVPNHVYELEEVGDDYFDSDDDDISTKKVDDVVTTFERACKLVGVVPNKRIGRELLGDRVDLDYASLITADIKAVCIALLGNTTVTRLDLSGNSLCEQAAQYISELINENIFITHLFCATCQLRARAVSTIVTSVAKSRNMVVLDLSENKLQDEEVKQLASLIQDNTVLRELRLRYCDIDEEGGRLLAPALADCCLEKLDLSWNQLRQKGGAAFCLALKDNNSIRELDLSWNGLGREGCAALETSLPKNDCLVWLNLDCNRVCTECLGHLLKGLDKNRTLETLKLAKNPISMDDAKLIVSSLLAMKRTTIKIVDISDVTVDNAFIHIQEQLQIEKRISIYYGGLLERPAQKIEQRVRTLASFDPILVLFEYMKQQNLRLIDLFRSLDCNHDNAISKQELRNGFLSLNMDLPDGVLSAAFHQLDLNSNNLIDIDELKNAHRRVLRQTANLMTRTQCDNADEGYGDLLHEFKKLVRAAAKVRKSPKPKDEDGSGEFGDSLVPKERSRRRLSSTSATHKRQSMSSIASSMIESRRPSATRKLSAKNEQHVKLRPNYYNNSPSQSPNTSPRSAHSSVSPDRKY